MTPIQHALLVHEGGFFSDAKGRLGRFPTIELLLKSKISALARYPLSFRRERDRYKHPFPYDRISMFPFHIPPLPDSRSV